MIGSISFLIANIPSLKLIFGPGRWLNIVLLLTLMLFCGVRICSRSYNLLANRKRLNLALTYTGFVVFSIAISLFMGTNVYPTFLEQLIKYLYFLAIFILIMYSAKRTDLVYFIYLQIIWGTIVAILFLAGIIKTNIPLGQHYNTISMPISISVLTIVSHLLFGKRKKTKEYFLLLITACLNIFAMLSLSGRSGLLFIPLVLVLSCVLFSPQIVLSKQHIVAIGLLLSAFSICILYVHSSVRLVGRLLSLFFNLKNESRVIIYLTTIKNILLRPFGHGIGYYQRHIGNYPHNFILEATFVSGVFAIILVVAVIYSFRLIIRHVKLYSDATMIPIVCVSFYMFFVLNVSYSITNLYLLFAPLALAVGVASERDMITKNNKVK